MAQAAAFEFVGAKNDDDHEWLKQRQSSDGLKRFDAVIMRTDPPFDMQYLYATQFFDIGTAAGRKSI